MTKIEAFPFQKDDIEKLSQQVNVLIGNEMGSGKSVEAVLLDLERRAQSPSRHRTLCIAPLSVLGALEWHFGNLTPELKVHRVDNRSKAYREQSFIDFLADDGDVYLVHWDVLRLMPELKAASNKWLHVIADECHRAQNRDAKQTKALKSIKTLYKTGMSGTPVTSTPDKLWSILNWLYPKEFSSYWRFFARYVNFEMQYANGMGYKKPISPKNVGELHEKLEPYYVRHLKKDRCCEHHPQGIMPELPDKYYSEISVDLTPLQMRAYKSMEETMIAWVGKNENTPLVSAVVVSQLIRLQQFAIGYCQVGADGKVSMSDPSSKLDAVMQLIEDNPDQQFVVFTQFAQVVHMLNKRLEDGGITYGSISGSVPGSQRDAIIDEFQANKARVFTGTIAAGGVGITLTSASTVIFVDRGWSPSINIQAEDRLWRQGQKNAVQVIDIVARGTLDRGRMQRIEDKWQNIRLLLGDLKNEHVD